MFLKSLEMCGFKSFADRTKLVFEPGLIAIVGPNGCGKSNVSDAIRWVLGEQRASALRGSKMMDVIFNGTDSRKQMGMCEVSITFADCDAALETEFSEVTITRRVFRTGESGYFINKSPCRLKDIQRLFMGTGIGTTSYSVMAQGQIDAILSSRPEDRRAIFEEAAGVTKYKADRKEALRKLEQTESNLVRIADVIREIKRQIVSLQRQAAKAERYKTLKSELRSLDLFSARLELSALSEKINATNTELSETINRENAALNSVASSESDTTAIRSNLTDLEDSINQATETAARDAAAFDHAKEIISIGEQRINDYRSWAERDNREASEMREQLTKLADQISALESSLKRLDLEHAAAQEEREIIQRRTEEERLTIDQLRRDLQAKRDESLERERRSVFLQNRLSSMDAQLHSANVQRERLTGEYNKIKTDLERLSDTQSSLEGVLETLRDREFEADANVSSIQNQLSSLQSLIHSGREEFSHKSSLLAAHQAKLDLLRQQEQNAESFQAGSKQLLDPSNPLQISPQKILGPLADHISAPLEIRPALEAVLRAWIDAIFVSSPSSAIEILNTLSSVPNAPTRLISSPPSPPSPYSSTTIPNGLSPLLSHLSVSPTFSPIAESLFSNVFLITDSSLSTSQALTFALSSFSAFPPPVAPVTIVTHSGMVFRSDGLFERYQPDAASPLARHLEIEDCSQLVAAESSLLQSLQSELADAQTHESSLLNGLNAARSLLDEARREVAQKEGELSSTSRDASRSRDRLNTVSAELHLALEQNRRAESEMDDLRSELQEIVASRDDFLRDLSNSQNTLRERESDFNDHNRELIDAKLREANRAQELSQTKNQIAIFENRISEIKRSIEGRAQGARSYDENIAILTAQINKTRESLLPMQRTAEESRTRLETLKLLRAEKNLDLQRAENRLSDARQSLDTIRTYHNSLDLRLSELGMKHQNRLDRLQTDYALSTEQALSDPLPPWPNNTEPTPEEASQRISLLSSQIAEMGAVNLVAIEEYKELEERFKLESAQEEDLIKAKDELLNLIRMINQKSAEMFKETFVQANENFEKMFTKLFNGGTAKLVIVENEEDPLECGVEIIARPPGKRLQSISLLSGGERTMTAVSLLFAIYLIKPSPFCLLDELDAALDDSNIGRFVQALKDFLVQSQFLIITHNQHSIANSGIVYGVTMPEKGVSKIVSMRLPKVGLSS